MFLINLFVGILFQNIFDPPEHRQHVVCHSHSPPGHHHHVFLTEPEISYQSYMSEQPWPFWMECLGFDSWKVTHHFKPTTLIILPTDVI